MRSSATIPWWQNYRLFSIALKLARQRDFNFFSSHFCELNSERTRRIYYLMKTICRWIHRKIGFHSIWCLHFDDYYWDAICGETNDFLVHHIDRIQMLISMYCAAVLAIVHGSGFWIWSGCGSVAGNITINTMECAQSFGMNEILWAHWAHKCTLPACR